ncbi:hypothetical protein GH5_02098 [Leishmania sp. Ghana 2012 LV757]|uniref:hypothetical protein n=1 Tax=Leishmania sp. Ghana 2012 LV757 TaxID=2803181 RepID=UPI001B5B5727|nr:hypothetical protein GH5_02098 [Leishmania sp. Ghana 2012 LV757]
MSFTYQRMKMRATTVAVDHMRSFCDGCNLILHAVTHPFKRLVGRVKDEAPWVNTLMACTLVTALPLIFYPYVKKYVLNDERAAAEAERVRLCLQKGIDPYPYMRHKDFVYGNSAPIFADKEQIPKRIGWEFSALENYYKRKEELRQEVGGSINDTVQKLMALKKEQRSMYDSMRGKPGTEPRDLIFHGQKEVNRLTS